MPIRLPSEYFREGARPETEAAAEVSATAEVPRLGPPAARRRWGEGVAPRLVIAGVLGALLLGFGIGRLLLLDPGAATTATPSDSVGPSPTTSAIPTLVPYDGPVRVLPVVAADGRCNGQVSRDEPANLFDEDPETFWRCVGPGVGETIRFRLEAGQPVVGVRVVNGNTVKRDRYLAERRILSIKWTFDDGSWMVQGLSANDLQPQEVRFPPVTATQSVTMTIMEATVAGGSADANAVSIASLDFLTVA